MIVIHFDSALELMTDGMEHELFDKEEMEQLLEGCAKDCDYQMHEFMWRSFKRMLRNGNGSNVIDFSPELRGQDVH